MDTSFHRDALLLGGVDVYSFAEVQQVMEVDNEDGQGLPQERKNCAEDLVHYDLILRQSLVFVSDYIMDQHNLGDIANDEASPENYLNDTEKADLTLHGSLEVPTE